MFTAEGASTFWTSWNDLRGDRALLHYRNLFEGRASKLIPRMVILERRDDGYMVRFVGTGVVELWGSDQTGANVNQIMPEGFIDRLLPLLDLVRTHPCSISSLANVETGRGPSVQLNIVILPIANDA
jgi:hypothetical protein